MLMTILPPIIIAATVTVTTVATIMYLTTAKRSIPLTKKEASILWKLHKQRASCQCNKMQHLTRNHGKIITGFKCQCGFRYVQKSPILARNLNSSMPQSKSTRTFHH